MASFQVGALIVERDIDRMISIEQSAFNHDPKMLYLHHRNSHDTSSSAYLRDKYIQMARNNSHVRFCKVSENGHMIGWMRYEHYSRGWDTASASLGMLQSFPQRVDPEYASATFPTHGPDSETLKRYYSCLEYDHRRFLTDVPHVCMISPNMRSPLPG